MSLTMFKYFWRTMNPIKQPSNDDYKDNAGSKGLLRWRWVDHIRRTVHSTNVPVNMPHYVICNHSVLNSFTNPCLNASLMYLTCKSKSFFIDNLNVLTWYAVWVLCWNVSIILLRDIKQRSGRTNLLIIKKFIMSELKIATKRYRPITLYIKWNSYHI